MHIKFYLGSLKGRDHLEDPSTDGLYENVSRGNQVWGFGLDSSGLRKGLVVGSCEYGSEPSESIEVVEYLH
jgi:hypothetical protein